MKSRVFLFSSLLALMIAFCATSVAAAQEITPGSDVYVKDFVQGDGNTNVDEPTDVCDENSTGGSGDNNGDGDNTDEGEACGPAPTNEVESNTESGGTPASTTATCESGADVDPVTGQPCSTGTVSSGDLPFTGFEAGLVALAGLALLGGGFAMRRFTRQSGTPA